MRAIGDAKKYQPRIPASATDRTSPAMIYGSGAFLRGYRNIAQYIQFRGISNDFFIFPEALACAAESAILRSGEPRRRRARLRPRLMSCTRGGIDSKAGEGCAITETPVTSEIIAIESELCRFFGDQMASTLTAELLGRSDLVTAARTENATAIGVCCNGSDTRFGSSTREGSTTVSTELLDRGDFSATRGTSKRC